VRALRELDGPDIAGIVQFGANVAMAQLAGEAEHWLGKPVVAVNTATYWHALRSIGVADRIPGFGRLLDLY
jgi:maleate isomerase